MASEASRQCFDSFTLLLLFGDGDGHDGGLPVKARDEIELRDNAE